MENASFSEQLSRVGHAFTAAERRVIDFLLTNRETAIMASAADIAGGAGTSDATVVRTARRLGFSGLGALRRSLAVDLKHDLSLSDRLENSLRDLSTRPAGSLGQVIATLRASLDGLSAMPAADFEGALDTLCQARRIRVFGIGPSGYVAGYFAAQMARMGADVRALRHTGLLFADDLQCLSTDDAVLALAYERPYPEVAALFDRASELALRSVLITAPGPTLPDHRADIVLRVARGSRDGIGLHAATLAVIEALLVGYAGRKHAEVRGSLEALNAARGKLSGRAMDL